MSGRRADAPIVLQQAVQHEGLADAFRQFSRNGRWGTCGACPRDSEKHVYPEFCPETDRYDHWLSAQGLADQFERSLEKELDARDGTRPNGSKTVT